MMVLTNGVLCDESRAEIKSIVSGIEMTYLGIGIGLYLCGFEDLFPTMIWNSNPYFLSETLSNLTNESMSESLNAVPEKKIDRMVKEKKFSASYKEMTKRICNIPSKYETTLRNVRFGDVTDGPDALSKIGNINDSKYDLGVDGGFTDYAILFIILYLCRGEKDENERVIDESITEQVLMYGKEVNGETFSPVLKLGDKEINGQPIGKGFKIGYAYDYKSAINALSSGRYRMTFITCSPGDGIMAKKSDNDVDQYADAFVACVHEFNMRGGGVFWFLENYPFTYEADLYFKTFYKFEAVGDKEVNIPGGKVMERVQAAKPKAGHFITVGGKTTDFYSLSRLDFGIVRIFEGRTLCTLNEKKLEGIGFRVFAKESEGYTTIMVKEKKEGSREGRMIIDTAASKLFLEFTEDGTARWISNAAVWLCNTEEFEEERGFDHSVKSGINMDGIALPGKKPMVKRETAYTQQQHKQVNFCMSIVIDTTGSMSSYIDATKENIVAILNQLKKIERDYHLPKGGIVGQVVQYKDYADTMTGERSEYITDNFTKLKDKLATFEADGGDSGADRFCWCEDIQGGLIRALEQMKQSPYNTYNHLILVVGDHPNHGETDDCKIKNSGKLQTISKQWDRIYRDIHSLYSIRIMFMPISPANITHTMKRMQSALGSKIVDSAPVTTETNFVKMVTDTAITEYKRFVGIS